MSLTNFEEITYELDEYELEQLPSIVKHLKKKIGKDNAVTSTEVIEAYKNANKSMTGARWRKIINYIRKNHLIPFLMASSKGYYIATDKEDVRKYKESLKQRIQEITAVYDAIEYDERHTDLKEYLKSLKYS